MSLFRSFLSLAATIVCLAAAAVAADDVRDLNVSPGSTLVINNPSGRVLAETRPAVDDVSPAAQLKITSPGTFADSEIKVYADEGTTTIEVRARDPKQRIDLMLTLPERTSLRVQTTAGSVEAAGNFAKIEAKTDTGTVAVDVPTDALQYHFLWTESRPRYLADFDIEKVKERSGGKFEIKGTYFDQGKPRKSENRSTASVLQGGEVLDALPLRRPLRRKSSALSLSISLQLAASSF